MIRPRIIIEAKYKAAAKARCMETWLVWMISSPSNLEWSRE